MATLVFVEGNSRAIQYKTAKKQNYTITSTAYTDEFINTNTSRVIKKATALKLLRSSEDVKTSKLFEPIIYHKSLLYHPFRMFRGSMGAFVPNTPANRQEIEEMRTRNNNKITWELDWVTGLGAEAIFTPLNNPMNIYNQLRKYYGKIINMDFYTTQGYIYTLENVNISNNVPYARIMPNIARSDFMLNLYGTNAVNVFEAYTRTVYYGYGDDRIPHAEFINYTPEDAPYAIVRIIDEARPVNHPQAFLKSDNKITHCFITPIIQKLTEAVKNTTVKKTKQKHEASLAKANEYYNKYFGQGVDIATCEKIAIDCNVSVHINDILNNSIYSLNKKAYYKIELCNTRFDHVDEITKERDSEQIVTPEIMKSTLKTFIDNKKFCIVPGSYINTNIIPKEIRTLDTIYKLEYTDIEAVEKINNFFKINDAKIDAFKNPRLNRFLKAGCVIHSSRLSVNPNIKASEYVEYDGAQAYTQFDQNKIYRGFLNTIATFCSYSPYKPMTFIDELHDRQQVGLFMVYITNTTEFFKTFGIYSNKKYIIASPELEYFKNNGVTFEIMGGAVGASLMLNRKDAPPEYFEKGKDRFNGLNLYAITAGLWCRNNDTNIKTCIGSKEFAETLAYQYKEKPDVKICHIKETDNIVIYQKKAHNYTSHHMTAFITAYTRMNMYDQLKNIGLENVRGVTLDGIILPKNTPVPESEIFRIKTDKKTHEIKIIESWEAAPEYKWFEPIEEVNKYLTPETLDVDILNRNAFLGAGGCGKSTSILQKPECFPSLCFVLPCHRLGQEFHKKFGANYTTINKFTGEGFGGKACRPHGDEYRRYGLYFIDEITQISKDSINKAFALYPNSCFILGGDLVKVGDKYKAFQCRGGNGSMFIEPYTNFTLFNVVEFKNDYRSECDKLKKLKQDVRRKMAEIYKVDDTGGSIAARLLNNWFMSAYKNLIVDFKDAVNKFETGDMWIAATHETNKKIMNEKITSCFIIKENKITIDGVDKYRGDTLPATYNYDEKNKGIERRGSVTTHGIQGFTLRDNKIFIVLNDSFEIAMLYTALSRATKLNQLVFTRI